MKPLILFAVMLSLEASAQTARVSDIDSLILQGIHAALRHDYDLADDCFRHAARVDRTHPAGPMFLAGLLYQRAEDLGIEFDRRAFDSLLTESEVRSRSREALSKNDPRIPLLRATAHGMLAVEEAGSGEWMAAIRDALASSSEAHDALERDPSLADAGLPLGNYLYWKSRKTEALHWLPLFDDERAEGIRLLEECALNGMYHRYAAISSLVWILHDAKELEHAEAWARKGLEAYPGNRTYLAGLAMVLESRGAHGEAAAAWADIVTSLGAAGVDKRYSVFSASVNQLRCVLAAGDMTQGRSLAAGIARPDRSQIPDHLRRRYQTKAAELDELKKKYSAMAASSGTSLERQ